MDLMDLYGKTLQKEVQNSDSQLCHFQNVIFEIFFPLRRAFVEVHCCPLLLQGLGHILTQLTLTL